MNDCFIAPYRPAWERHSGRDTPKARILEAAFDMGSYHWGKIWRMKRHYTRKKGLVAVLCGEIKIQVVL